MPFFTDPKIKEQAGILDRKSATFNAYSTTRDHFLSSNNETEKNNIIKSKSFYISSITKPGEIMSILNVEEYFISSIFIP